MEHAIRIFFREIVFAAVLKYYRFIFPQGFPIIEMLLLNRKIKSLPVAVLCFQKAAEFDTFRFSKSLYDDHKEWEEFEREIRFCYG